MLKEKESLNKLELCYQKQRGKCREEKREYNSLPTQKGRKDLLFMFVVRTARSRLKGRMMSGLCRGTVVTTAKTCSERMKLLLCWVGNKESNQTAALDCNSISVLWPKGLDLKPQELGMQLQLWSLRYSYTYVTFPMEKFLLILVQVLTPGKLHQWIYWASASSNVMELFASNSSCVFIPGLN